jgi:hypothetical protein
MITPTNVSSRDIVRNYKSIFETVKKTKKPAIVISKKQAQVAIIPMEDLAKLQQIKNKQSTKALLAMSGLIPKGSGLPADLSEKHDEYTWD